MDSLIILPESEYLARVAKVRQAMDAIGVGSAIISTPSSIFYLTGRVFSGYAYLPPMGASPVFFVKRPVHLAGQRVFSIRKPENMLELIKEHNLPIPDMLGLELSAVPYAMAVRIAKAMGADPASLLDVSAALSMARAVKTPYELHLLEVSGSKHERVYGKIPQLFEMGMTDVELQVEIERLSRLEGCLGQFRIAGQDMELYMGNVLAGANADAPSPYDFAMGGAGMDPSLPVGANGTLLRPGMSVMVDMNGNYTGYMTDMTRTFSVGQISQEARDAHQLSIDICHALALMGRPGVAAKDLYAKAEEMARKAGYADYFMGHRQHAGFVGHGVGIEVNELPVIAPRSRDILAEGNVIALEPKFVIPGVGAVGIENTYIVQPYGLRSITNAPEALIQLDE